MSISLAFLALLSFAILGGLMLFEDVYPQKLDDFRDMDEGDDE